MRPLIWVTLEWVRAKILASIDDQLLKDNGSVVTGWSYHDTVGTHIMYSILLW
jgi:hypothetical protein